MPETLTDRQSEILGWIRDYIDEHQRPPTQQEIGDAHDIASASAVRDHLLAMKKKGWVTWEPNQPRTLKILDGSEAA